MSYTTAAEFEEAYTTVRATFASHKTKDKKWRRQQLARLFWMLEDNKERFAAAEHKDVNRHAQETNGGEIGFTQAAAITAYNDLDKLMAPERPASTNLFNCLLRATIHKVPVGTVLVISAWNFPINVLLHPTVDAIAAGCTVVLKPSELVVATQDLLMELIPKYMDPEAIRCVTGGPAEMTNILAHKWDHICFTGSGRVGEIVYRAATKYLTPVTLELGGQAPAIITKEADIDLSAKRIAWVKTLHAGQVCLSVNHVFVDPAVRDRFVAALTKQLDAFREGTGADEPPGWYSHVINERNFDRLEGLLQRTAGTVAWGGRRERGTLYFGTTVVTGVRPDDALMSEELFGPILPIIDADLDEAIRLSNAGDRPLALYGFTDSRREKDRLLAETCSGSIAFNETLMQTAVKDAPFGGTGASGMGYYHGAYGFNSFSHHRTAIDPYRIVDLLLGGRYPPYTAAKAAKAGPPAKPTFDRNGKDTRSSLARWMKNVVFVLGMAALLDASLGAKWGVGLRALMRG